MQFVKMLKMSTGPKGVINDWRRFKLESLDQENVPSAKKELLRQMSSPSKSKDDSRANLNRKVAPRQVTSCHSCIPEI